MQAIREKISDIRGTRKVKSDSRHEQQQAEWARAQEEAHEARLIREAEIAMGMHAEEYIQHRAKLTGDHMNTTGYGGSGLNNRHVADHTHGSYGGAATRYSGGAYTTSPGHDSRKMAIHHKYL
uniref:uncharacterized protein LOC122590479 n=1 Tax=Erigeron canadensis TaxID=72917 RepID=UPI001CB8B74D|nr:uncharacterized protein LOC122590479 [Erigeron canadensis]